MTTGILPAIVPATYTVDPGRSRVSFTVRALFGLATVRGTMAVTEGSVVVADDPVGCRATVTVDAASFDTGNRRRDADVCSPRFLDAPAHPLWSFRATAFDGTSLTGVLSAHGTDADVTFTITSSPSPGGCRFGATARLDRHAFGVTSGKGMIGRYLDVDVTLTATPR